jgi:hypothetical protein
MSKAKAARRRIMILGKPYYLVEIAPGSAPDFSGTNNRDDQTITIVAGQGAEAQADTILHESLHIIDKELALGLSEETVARLACGLHSAGCRVEVVE